MLRARGKGEGKRKTEFHLIGHFWDAVPLSSPPQSDDLILSSPPTTPPLPFLNSRTGVFLLCSILFNSASAPSLRSPAAFTPLPMEMC
ncbi:hypothetical protein SDJN02_26091 [Cucurbita argyrosperma subsp. argyrosperma]|nr:hypothetical protein SDJN02_26091 [Cucurbita argyrosperma subsp. argyrosperma]